MALNPVSPSALSEQLLHDASMESRATSPGAAGSFSGMLHQLVGNAAQSHVNAEAAVRDLALGKTDNLHGVMLQMAQADLSFRLVLEIRNRLTEAYQEIMKMQV